MVVVAVVTSSVTHTMLASDIRRDINERSRRLDWEEHSKDLDERGPDCFKRQDRMPQHALACILQSCGYHADLTGLLEVGGLLFSISMPPCALLLRKCVHNCCGADERWNLGKIEFKI